MCTSFYQLFLPFTTYFAYSNKIAKRSEPHTHSLSFERWRFAGKTQPIARRNLRQTFNERKMYERVNVKVCTCSSNDVKRDKQFDVECRGCNYPNKSIESKSMVITWANSFSRQRNALDFVSKFKQKSHSVHSMRWWFTIISKQIRNAHTHQTSSTRRRPSDFVRSCARLFIHFVSIVALWLYVVMIHLWDVIAITLFPNNNNKVSTIFLRWTSFSADSDEMDREENVAFGLRSQYAELPSIAAVVVSLNFNGTPVIRFVSYVFVSVRPSARETAIAVKCRKRKIKTISLCGILTLLDKQKLFRSILLLLLPICFHISLS